MDEVGRGTSTFDGLSLAWAAAEQLATLKAWTLFATHYFELTSLPERLSSVANVHLSATEHQDRIVFLHHVRSGPANQSYGLAVAQLAGVPNAVIARAREHLKQLEDSSLMQAKQSNSNTQRPIQNDLFATQPHHLLLELQDINPDELSPKQALDLLYAWKSQI